jgi:hypothetical protein
MKYEFYRDQTGCFIPKIYDLADPQTRRFAEFTEQECLALFDHLCTFPKARRGLLHLAQYFEGHKRDILRRFIECNWTEIDDMIDVSEDTLNFEYVPCRHKGKGTCPFKGEGVVCVKSKKEDMPMDTES